MLQTDIDPVPYIDYAVLDPAASHEQIDRACEEADRLGFASVCVYPCNVKRATERLLKTKVEICTVIGFPSGAT